MRAKTAWHRARMVAPRTMERLQVEAVRMRAQVRAVRKLADLAERQARAVPRSLLRTQVKWMPRKWMLARRLSAPIRRQQASKLQSAELAPVELLLVAQEPRRVEAGRVPLEQSQPRPEVCAGSWFFPPPFAEKAVVRLVGTGAAWAEAELAGARSRRDRAR